MNKLTTAFQDQVLAPVSIDSFFAQYWEQQPLHISRCAEHHFSELVSIRQLETLLSTRALHFPTAQLTKSGAPVPLQDYTDGASQIVPRQLIRQYHEGATIILSQAHQLLPALADFCRAVQRSLQLNCQTNVYLSPPDRQGFNAHYDAHDVFILQVAGNKTFNFYDGSIDLPTRDDSFDPLRHASGQRRQQIHLTAGDTLYIPRGVMHDAIAHDLPSLHVTLGVYPVAIHDLLQEILQIATERDPSYRRSVTRECWLSDQPPEGLNAPLSALLNNALSPDNLELALSRLRDGVAISCEQDCSDSISATAHVDNLTADTVISWRHGAVMGVEQRAATVRVRTFGRVVEFGPATSTAVLQIMERAALPLNALHNLPPDQLVALTTQLLAEGLIDIVSAPSSD